MLPSKIKNRILKNGLVHYTNTENAKNIVINNYIGDINKNVYFFVNEQIALDVLCYNLRYVDSTNGNRSIDTEPSYFSIAGKNTEIIISNLTDNQINYLSYYFSNEAVVFPDRFIFDNKNDIFIRNIDLRDHPRKTKNKLFLIIKVLFFNKGQLDKLNIK